MKGKEMVADAPVFEMARKAVVASHRRKRNGSRGLPRSTASRARSSNMIYMVDSS